MSYLNFWKRIFDVIFSFAAIVVLLVPSFLVIITIKLTSPGPIFYSQRRIGRFGEVFTIYKFRTMKVNSPEVESSYNTDKNYRTHFGKIIRRVSIDEWPQFFNILQGKMSLIGPRPMIVKSKVNALRQQYPQILQLRPGISGLAQVEGRNKISDRQKVEWDKEYADNASLLLDIKIFFKTFIEIFFLNNISDQSEKQ